MNNKIKNFTDRFKGLTTIGITNLSTNGIASLFWLYIAGTLGTNDYGKVSYFIAAAGIGITFSSLGAANVLTVYTAKGVKIQATTYFVTIIAAIFASIIVFLIFNNAIVGLFVFSNVIFTLMTAELLGQKLFRKYATYLIIQKILMVGLAIIFYHFIGPDGVILGIAASMLIGLIRIYEGFKESRIEFSLLKSRLGFIGNNYVLEISRSLNGTLDKVIIGPMLGFSLLGNYQLGLQFLSILAIVPSIIYSYTLTHDASGNPNRALKKLTIVASVVLAILGISLSPLIIPLLFPKYTHAIQVIQIISLTVIPSTINLTLVSKFLGSEKTRIVLVGAMIYLIILITGIVGLGKLLGVNGAAAGVVLANSSETIYLLIINRHFKKHEIT